MKYIPKKKKEEEIKQEEIKVKIQGTLFNIL